MNTSHLLASTILALRFASFSPGAELEFPVPSERELVEALGGAEVLKAIRGTKRMEAVRLREEKPLDKEGLSTFVETGRRFELSPKQTDVVRALFGDRCTYAQVTSACIFEPGIKLIVHYGETPPAEWLLCLRCAEVGIDRGGEHVGFASFLNRYKEVLALATVIFPDDKDISDFIAELKAGEGKDARDRER